MQFIRYHSLLLLVILITGCWSCQSDSTKEKENTSELPQETRTPAHTLFTLLSPEKTGITFSNTLTDSPYANILMYQYFYNGGGVAIGDINNDGLQDIYFSGNMTNNRLYLNTGNMQFEDITDRAGVTGRPHTWQTGVTMADVNGDSLQDIYLCYSGNMPGIARINQLFINQGADEKGIPIFLEQAGQYGLADSSYSTSATFFDYDRDNDLDVFLLNHNPELFRNLDDVSINEILKRPDPDIRVKLYRNHKGRFEDVSDQAGFYKSAFTYGLGAGVADFNGDGWPDIYISNDYSAPDYLYINNGDGTFTDQLKQSIGHIPYYSMGNDVSDINNDGLPDIFALDMLPEDNRRQKLLFSPENYEHFNLFLRVGFYYQYMRNMLQINNGNGTFSEIGQLAGLSNTDWSWAPLIADYDNDGWKDVFVSNGFLRDFTNLDFIKYRSSLFQQTGGNINSEGIMALVNKIPASNIRNYIFKNNGNLTFSNQGADWGMNVPSNSNGAAYADLDNDGDLDMVINNINQPAFVYQNQSRQHLNHHYLQVKLEGAGKNTAGIGAKVTLYTNGKQQYQEQIPSRGFQSSVSPVLHFGLGEDTIIDSLQVVWQSGKGQILKNAHANQVITLQEKEAVSKYYAPEVSKSVFKEVKSPVAFTHQAHAVNDFKRQPLLVNPLSFTGPCLIKDDVNGDGLEDIFTGGAKGQPGILYIQQRNGSFIPKINAAFEADKMSEDVDAIFFDANNDQFPDLYIVSGGYHDYSPGDVLLQDRLYLNDGKGNFTKNTNALPKMLTSASCVRTADMNADGNADLFVGGRVIPGRYPQTPQSYVLINDGKGNFTDQTTSIAPALQKIGMVTDAAWHDLNGDSIQELIVVGEWMPITVFSNVNGKLRDNTSAFFDKTYSGWWNKLLIGDFNNDQKPDLIIGNLGLNAQVKATDHQPAELYYKDFDDNGSLDPILSFYIQGKSYPYVTRDELLDQISTMRTRFTSYESYADATVHTIFTAEELKGAGHLSANFLQTAYFESTAQGKFQEKVLPSEVQFSPVYAIASLDYNQDGNLDLLVCGNMNAARLRFGKYDANYGILLQGDGKGRFTYVSQSQSGFELKGDVRSILPVNNTLLFGINGQAIKAYQAKK